MPIASVCALHQVEYIFRTRMAGQSYAALIPVVLFDLLLFLSQSVLSITIV